MRRRGIVSLLALEQMGKEDPRFSAHAQRLRAFPEQPAGAEQIRAVNPGPTRSREYR